MNDDGIRRYARAGGSVGPGSAAAGRRGRRRTAGAARPECRCRSRRPWTGWRPPGEAARRLGRCGRPPRQAGRPSERGRRQAAAVRRAGWRHRAAARTASPHQERAAACVRGSRTSPLAPSGVSMPQKANSARIRARPKSACAAGTAAGAAMPGETRAPATTKNSSGISLMAVAPATRRAAPRTPRKFTRAMPPMTPRTTPARSNPATGDGRTSVSATAAAMPPHASTLEAQISMPATKPGSRPNAASTYP